MSVLRRKTSRRPGIGSHMRLSIPTTRLPLSLVIAAWCARRAARATLWTLRHPGVIALTAACAAMWWLVDWALTAIGPIGVGTGAAGLATTATLWRINNPTGYRRIMGRPLRSTWRKVSRYRRDWQPAMVCSGLAPTDGERLPQLVRVRSQRAVDVVRARMLPGQTLEDWTKAAPRLAQTFAVREVRAIAVPGSYQHVDLWAMTGDPLTAPVPPAAPCQWAPGLTAVPVGVREDGQPFHLRLLHSHLLVAGATGSGKGSVVWSLVVGVAPLIRKGLVRLWVIDPKGGMELAAGEPLFDRFVHGEPAEIADLLEQAVVGMRARADRLRGTTRKLEPTAKDPLVVVVIDELASLTAWVPDRTVKQRIANALSLLLSQGRAVGVSVVGATQDVRKEVLPMRDLFPNRVCLRTAEAGQVDLVLGAGARERGATADRISDATPGVGFAIVDDHPQPVRVRFSHITDDHIAATAFAHDPRTTP